MVYGDLFQSKLSFHYYCQSCLICVSQLDDVTFLTFKSAEYTATIFNISQMTKYLSLQGTWPLNAMTIQHCPDKMKILQTGPKQSHAWPGPFLPLSAAIYLLTSEQYIFFWLWLPHYLTQPNFPYKNNHSKVQSPSYALTNMYYLHCLSISACAHKEMRVSTETCLY